MRQQRNMAQMKEQGKTPEEQLSEVEMGNLPEKEFTVMILKMIQDLRKRMEAQIEMIQEIFNKELEELKNKQTEMNKMTSEMKNTLEGISSMLTEAEEWISELEDRTVEITATEQNKEKRMKINEDSLRDIWNNIKHTKVCITEVPEGEDREKVCEKIFEKIIDENFHNMGK